MLTKKVICAGHICLDITPVFDGKRQIGKIGELLVPGKLINVSGAEVHTGGSVANTGLAMKILGNDVTLMGKIGCDSFGGIVKNILHSYGCAGLIEDGGATTSYSIVLAPPGIDRIFLHDPGANDSFVASDVSFDALARADLFHFGYPTLMKAMFRNGGRELAALFEKAKDAGCMTSLDLSAVDPASEAGRADWARILGETLPYVDFFVPSFEELLYMLSRDEYDALQDQKSDVTQNVDFGKYVRPLAQRCIGMGARAVLIKCGISGMYLKTADKKALEKLGGKRTVDVEAWERFEKIEPCFKADVVRSAAGAGDVSIAAFLTAVLKGCAPGECIGYAAAEGALAVTSYDALGAVEPLEELKKRIQKGWERIG